MIDNLTEAIRHAKETAKKLRAMTSVTNGKPYDECLECAKEHEQLAEWLTELQERRETDRVLGMLKTHQTILTIPENPTNGDMIMALFPNAEIFKREDYDYPYVYVTIKDMGNCWKIRGEWWNSEYKESEDK